MVLAVIEKQEPSPDELKKSWDRAKETLLDQKRQELEGLYVQNLRDAWKKKARSRSTRKKWSA